MNSPEREDVNYTLQVARCVVVRVLGLASEHAEGNKRGYEEFLIGYIQDALRNYLVGGDYENGSLLLSK